ncbi:MAG: hypothetical protein HYY16_06055 [Planctomycetes bacterium]|nr:hypothetical protein [Planctomycetota bacterium]
MIRVATALLLAAGVLALFAADSAAVSVQPSQYVTKLTDEQKQELFKMLLAQAYTPTTAVQAVDRAIVLNVSGLKSVTIGVGEDEPGELPPPLVWAVTGHQEIEKDPYLYTWRGDGFYKSSPSYKMRASWGTALVFEGTKSVKVPMKLSLDLTFTSGGTY